MDFKNRNNPQITQILFEDERMTRLGFNYIESLLSMLGIKKGLKKGKIEMMLEIKFGKEGLAFMKHIHKISDLKKLDKILQLIKTANNLSELKAILQKSI